MNLASQYPCLIRAFQHVRKYYPEVRLVSFDQDGRWAYQDLEGNCPVFGPEVNVSILEDAQAEVDNSRHDFQRVTYLLRPGTGELFLSMIQFADTL